MGWLSSKERKRAKNIRRRIQNIINILSNIIGFEDRCRSSVRNQYDKMRENEALNALKNMSVDEINYNKAGIRVSALKNAGIDNLWQLFNMRRSDITAINGIGESSVDKIMNNLQNLFANAKQNAKVRLSAQNRTKASDSAIMNLFYLTKAGDITDVAKNLYDANVSSLNEKLKSAKKMSNPLTWLFSSEKAKKKMMQDVNDLEAILNSDLSEQVNGLFEKSESLKKSSVDDCLSDFDNNASSYYAKLDNVMGVSDEENIAGIRKISADQAAYGNIIESDVDVEELIEEINRVELDLSLLNVTLRRYQEFGTKYIVKQKRTLLGDEMGLGKTMQAIAAMTHLQAVGKTHFMVICPLSVLENWKREVSTHSKLNVIGIYGDEEARAVAFNTWLNDGGVAITTYETVQRLVITDTLSLDMVTVDEAHYIKNPEAARTKAIVDILDNTESVLYMTGTPIENKIDEMKYLIRCLQPDIYELIKDINDIEDALNFREVIMPVYLRRTRDDVLKELPELIEKEEWCEMSAKELLWYKDELSKEDCNFMKLRQISWNMADVSDSTKATRLMEICEEAAADGRRIIVFSFFLGVLETVQNMLGDRCVGLINGSVPPAERQGLVDKLKEAPAGSVLVSQIISGGVGLNIQCASVVIFCEPQVKPSMEMQALSRAYRMGQTRDVLVHRLLMADSVDERMLETLKQKTQVFNEFADESIVGQRDIEINDNAMKTIVEEEKKRLGVSE